MALFLVLGSTPVLCWAEEKTIPNRINLNSKTKAIEDSIKYPLSQKISEATQSRYSDEVHKILKRWPPAEIPDVSVRTPYWYRAVRTPEDSGYIGTIRRTYVAESCETLLAVLNDFNHYNDLFGSLIGVKVTQVDANKVTTSWERSAPVFFMPSIRYEMVYLRDYSNPARMMYRYQLKGGDTLTASDGLIVLEKQDSACRLTALDFHNANWGIAKTIGLGRIWRDSLKGEVVSDLSIKLRVEHQDWSYQRVQDKARELAPQFSESVIYLDHFKFE